ncbi:hypothetical protein [Nocardia cyriacigeorgica]|uniref:hypothetical protein n=1 Tax=Nocardia cyriacigeorgica TaxID=135487 RepID=UPI001893B2F9|nr:hypothetical protein [Nocardia cyriacigeorgica]MBF6289275.1 hypothetical protein [Nocardia cyriacigeorgica]
MTPTYTPGQPVVWENPPACSCSPRLRRLVTFERIVGCLMPGYAQVFTCRGLCRVPLAELRPAGPGDLSPIVDPAGTSGGGQ